MREGLWRWRRGRWSTLQWALAVSVAAHAAVLAIRVADPEAVRRAFTDTPLEVILVNARGREPPSQAQALAQANLAGGGQAASGRATSPLPMAATTESGDAAETTQRQLQQLQQEQQMLLAQVRRELAMLPVPTGAAREGQSTQQREQEERRRQLVRLLAEIEKRIDQENARPRKRYVSPATREAVYAAYYDALRRRIEERGTRDFPEQQGRKLYGELTMNITVDAAGRVVAAEIVQPSDSRVLDQRAVAIVQGAAPYGPFTAQMRLQADQIVVTSRFRFTRNDSLETTVAGPGG
jgi:protein TonB